MQYVLVYITLAVAVGYLVKRFFFPEKKTKKACGKDDCGCG